MMGRLVGVVYIPGAVQEKLEPMQFTADIHLLAASVSLCLIPVCSHGAELPF